MKHLLTTAAILVALVGPAMASENFTFEQTSVRSQPMTSPEYPDNKMVIVSYILRNYADRTYKEANIVCGLFVQGRLVGTATKLYVNIAPLSRTYGDAWTSLNVAPDATECQVQTHY
jgi:hypothetical protein